MRIIVNAVLLVCCLLGSRIAGAEILTIAVASNFHGTTQHLAERFRQSTGHRIRISTGSSGKLFAQIVNGAPFDVFLSADEARPAELEKRGLIVAGSRFDYARGKLILWSQREQYAGKDCLACLTGLNFDYLAIANPETAPYGSAARDWLQRLGLWDEIRGRVVTGENIGQAFHFAASGNASLGLVAASQLKPDGSQKGTCQYVVPENDYRAISQQAVLIKRASENQAAIEFLAFLRSEQAATIIRADGYSLP